MTNDTTTRRSDLIAEEAASWFISLGDADSGTRADFVEWLKVSPEHVNEFLSIAAIWDALPEVKAQPSSEQLMRLAACAENVLELGRRRVVAGTSKRARNARRYAGLSRWFLGGVAAAVLAAAGFGIQLLLPHTDPNLYETRIGEQASISLPDGSIITLNTRSRVRVDYSDTYRDVELLSGEALFEVARDPERPFRVIVGTVIVRAVGTQFNVRKRPEDVTVTVVEGLVDLSSKNVSQTAVGRVAPGSTVAESANASRLVEPVRLTVGQQATVQSGSGKVSVVEATVADAIAWQARRLVFESMTLRQVIEEFNRYNYPPIEIDDPSLETLPISGVFRAHDRESFLQFLSEMNLAESYVRPDGTIVLRGTTGN